MAKGGGGVTLVQWLSTGTSTRVPGTGTVLKGLSMVLLKFNIPDPSTRTLQDVPYPRTAYPGTQVRTAVRLYPDTDILLSTINLNSVVSDK
eukprot:SAG31_NODE_16374_length_711_cov_2.071895_1_plen_91_part_00